MRLVRRLFALLLIAVWLPATVHCSLEAAGFIAAHCGDDCSLLDGNDDGCDVVENGLYKSSTPLVKASAPELVRLVFELVPRPDPEPTVTSVCSPGSVSEPQRLRCTWQFVERAAPPSRAPALSA